jgi:hypothetical protein
MRSNNLEHERVKPIEQRMRCAFIAAANGLHKRIDKRRSASVSRLMRMEGRFCGNGKQWWRTGKMTAEWALGYIFSAENRMSQTP